MKKAKGLTYIELMISIILILLISAPIFFSFYQIFNISSKIEQKYSVSLSARDVLEATERIFTTYGTDYFENKQELTANKLIETMGLSTLKDFNYRIILEDIRKNKTFDFKDDQNLPLEHPSIQSNYTELFSEPTSTLDADIYINEDAGVLKILKGNEFVVINNEICEINVSNLTKYFVINYETTNANPFRFIIRNNSDKDIIFKTSSDTYKPQVIYYYANGGALYKQFKKREVLIDNYFITVAIFDKRLNLLKRLETLV